MRIKRKISPRKIKVIDGEVACGHVIDYRKPEQKQHWVCNE